MKQIDEIEIISPRPHECVGSEFVLSGRIPKSWLKTSWGGMDYRVLGGFLDIDGFEFASAVTAYVKRDLFSVFKKKLYFSNTAQFSQFNVMFIAKSQGRIALKLSGHKEGFEFRVYSGDHNPKHFHVIHKNLGIDAHFSYPKVELVNYKGRSNTISRKESDRICEFFRITGNFEKLESEFKKQIS